MNYLKLIIGTTVVLGTVSSVSFAEETQNPMADKFDYEFYCETVDPSADKIIPDELTQILDDASGQQNGNKVADAFLKKAAINVAHASTSKAGCLKTFADGNQQFETLLKSKLASFQVLGHSRKSHDAEIRKIQETITDFWREDQSARGIYVALITKKESGSEYWAYTRSAAHTKKIDEASKTYLKATLVDYDWIDRKRFGKIVSDQAWLIAQHADNDLEFQRLALSRMEPYLKNRRVSRSNYAYLWDRVAVNSGQEQRYGTQPDWICVNGKMKLRKMEAPETVNKRRKKMGLGSVEAGLEQMNRQTCGSSLPDK